MNVPLLDLKAQYAAIKPEVDAAIADVMESQHFILGPEGRAVREGDRRATRMRARHRRLLGQRRAAGLPDGRGHRPRRRGDHHAVHVLRDRRARSPALGATPVFVDIDPATYNLDAAQIAAKITSADTRHHPGAPLRPDGRHGRRHAHRRSSTAWWSSRTPRRPSAPSTRAAAPARSGTTAASRSSRRRISARAGDGGMIVTNDAAARREAALPARPRLASRSTTTRSSAATSGSTRIQAAVVSAKLPHLDDVDRGAPAQRRSATTSCSPRRAWCAAGDASGSARRGRRPIATSSTST